MRRRILNARARYQDLLHKLSSPLGRMEILFRQYHRLQPVLFWAARFYRRCFLPRTKIVVVVGSFGKSTTARSVLTALRGDEKKLSQRNSGSFLARALLRARPWHRHVVIEVGIGGTGEMARNARMLQPDITVVTCVGSEHNRSLGTLATTRHEKAEMVRVLKVSGLAVLNGDDPNVRWMATQTRAKVIYFGFDEANNIRASRYQIDWPKGSRFLLHSGRGTHEMRLRLIGRHMAYSALAAAAVALHEGILPEKVLARLASLPPTAGRMQAVGLPNGAIVLRDDYKSTLETIYAALDALEEIPGRRFLVIGAVSEPPGKPRLIYGQLCKRIAEVAGRVILVNRKTTLQYYKSSLKAAGYSPLKVDSIRQRKDGRASLHKAVELIQKDLKPGDVILVKGRTNQHFERIAFELAGQEVGCTLDDCGVKMFNCEYCPRLRHG